MSSGENNKNGSKFCVDILLLTLRTSVIEEPSRLFVLKHLTPFVCTSKYREGVVVYAHPVFTKSPSTRPIAELLLNLNRPTEMMREWQ